MNNELQDWSEPAEEAADANTDHPGHSNHSGQANGPDKPRHRAGPSDINDPELRREAKRAFIWIGMVALFGICALLAQPLLVIFGGVVFAALIDGGARLLGRALPIPRIWRVAMVLLVTVAFCGWLIMFAGGQLAAQAAELPATIERQFHLGVDWLQSQGFRINAASVQGIAEKAIGGIGEVTRALGGLLGGFTTTFLIIVIGIYFALEPRLYQRGVGWMFPRESRDELEKTAIMMGAALRRLLFGRVVGMVVEGIATWALLEIYGVPMAALLGIITGLLAFLPNIGAPVSGAIMIMVGYSGGADMGLYTIIVYLVVQTVDGYIIVPMIARRMVDLAPVLVLAAQLIMWVLFGLLGLILADPLVAMIKVWLERRAASNEKDDQPANPSLTYSI